MQEEKKRRYGFNPFATSSFEAGGWSALRPGRFTPGKDIVSIVQEARWAPGSV